MKKYKIKVFLLTLSMSISTSAFADNSLFDELTKSQKFPIFYQLIKSSLKAQLPGEDISQYLFNRHNFMDRPSYNFMALSAELVAQVLYSAVTLVPGGRRPDVDISDLRYIQWSIPRDDYFTTECSAELMMTPENLNYPNNNIIKASIISLTLDKGTKNERFIQIPESEMKIFVLKIPEQAK